MSCALRTSKSSIATPRVAAAARLASHCGGETGFPIFCMKATREIDGSISLINSMRFPASSVTNALKPVMLLPSAAQGGDNAHAERLADSSHDHGDCRRRLLGGPSSRRPRVTMRSTCRRTSSSASVWNRSAWPSAERYSMTRLLSPQHIPVAEVPPQRLEIRGIRGQWNCFQYPNPIGAISWAHAANGHAAAPPKSVMKSRRLMTSPKLRRQAIFNCCKRAL